MLGFGEAIAIRQVGKMFVACELVRAHDSWRFAAAASAG